MALGSDGLGYIHTHSVRVQSKRAYVLLHTCEHVDLVSHCRAHAAAWAEALLHVVCGLGCVARKRLDST
jgi:hypothetical protein